MSDYDATLSTNRRTVLAGLRHLAVDEEGAAYTLSYVMVIPMYALLICTIVEMTLMLTSKLGTVYAAYAAARSASVWSSATEWEKVQEKAKRAAIQAMVPFASGTQPLAETVLTGTVPDEIKDNIEQAIVDAGFYWGAYQLYAKHPVPTDYLKNKYIYATLQTEIEIEGPPEKWDDDIAVKVKYKFPFNVPGVGRIMGKPGIDGRYYFTIETTVSIPNEGTQNDDNSIGIGYGKLD